MIALLRMDQAGDLDSLAEKLTSFNVNSFTEVLLATIAGALFAFAGSLALYALERKKTNNRRNRDALIEFMRWMAQEGLPARREADTYIHYMAHHPREVEARFPNGALYPNRAIETAEIQRMALSMHGIVAELVGYLKAAYECDDIHSEWIVYVHWTTFCDIAGAYLQGDLKSRNQLLDAYRSKEAGLHAAFPRRHEARGCCAPS